MLIGGLQKLTLIDYPGKTACTVFSIGCNFRCPWCYAGELILRQRTKAVPKISERNFFNFLKKRKGFLDGVVLCGGEPCLHDNLPAFCGKIKSMGYAVKLDTNGSNPAMLKKLFKGKLVDYLAMDVKAPLGQKSGNKASAGQCQKYEKAVGKKIDLETLKKSIELIKNSGVDYEFRTTIVPGIHSKEDIVRLAKEISPAKKYYLQGFRPENAIVPDFQKLRPFSDKYMKEIQKAVIPFFDVCKVR